MLYKEGFESISNPWYKQKYTEELSKEKTEK
jgi:hypothetical protein